MIIAIGSTNKAKVEAVKEAIQNYQNLAKKRIFSFSTASDVSPQPLSLEETIRGSKNRAIKAFAVCESCAYSFGIESGLMEAPGTQTGFLNVCACTIFDGVESYLGLSCGFEVPPKILQFVLEQKMDLTQACLQAGITKNSEIGSTEGLVGILTNGQIDRKEYTKQSIIPALAQLANAHWFKPVTAA